MDKSALQELAAAFRKAGYVKGGHVLSGGKAPPARRVVVHKKGNYYHVDVMGQYVPTEKFQSEGEAVRRAKSVAKKMKMAVWKFNEKSGTFVQA